MHAGLVLHALVTLAQRLLDDHGQVVLLLRVAGLVQVHEHGHERCLAVGGHQRDHLVLDGLHAAADLLAQAVLNHLGDLLGVGVGAQHLGLLDHLVVDALAADLHERGQMRQADGLAAVLARCYLGNNLRGDVAGGREAVRLLIRVPEITVPFCSMSSRFTKSQLCMCCAKYAVTK